MQPLQLVLEIYGMIPSQWRKSVIVLIPKKRSRDVCKADDFHRLHIRQCVYRVVHSKLLHMMEEKQLVVKEQGGFRRKRREESAVTSSWHWYILLGQMKAGQEGGWLPAVS